MSNNKKQTQQRVDAAAAWMASIHCFEKEELVSVTHRVTSFGGRITIVVCGVCVLI